jgi:hypothetical protein
LPLRSTALECGTALQALGGAAAGRAGSRGGAPSGLGCVAPDSKTSAPDGLCATEDSPRRAALLKRVVGWGRTPTPAQTQSEAVALGRGKAVWVGHTP